MEDIEGLQARLSALEELGLEGPGADDAAAALEEVADAVEALLQDPKTRAGSGA